jgi:hypothetical protein
MLVVRRESVIAGFNVTPLIAGCSMLAACARYPDSPAGSSSYIMTGFGQACAIVNAENLSSPDCG